MKLFITGATGGIGQNLISSLSQNHELVLLSLDKCEISSNNNIKIILGSILKPEEYQGHLKGVDIILHLAAITHTNNTAAYYQVNTHGTQLLVDAAEQNNIDKFIFVSTRAIGEDGGAYSDSKLLAERIVKNSSLMWTIVRPAEIYGVAEGEAITKLINNIKNKMPIIPIIGNGLYKIAPVYIDDVITAIENIIKSPGSIRKTYNLSGPEELTFIDFVDLVLKKNNLNKIKVKIPVLLLKTAAQILSILKYKKTPIVKDQIPRLLCSKSADISLAKKDLNYRPISINDYLSR